MSTANKYLHTLYLPSPSPLQSQFERYVRIESPHGTTQQTISSSTGRAQFEAIEGESLTISLGARTRRDGEITWTPADPVVGGQEVLGTHGRLRWITRMLVLPLSAPVEAPVTTTIPPDAEIVAPDTEPAAPDTEPAAPDTTPAAPDTAQEAPVTTTEAPVTTTAPRRRRQRKSTATTPLRPRKSPATDEPSPDTSSDE